MIVFVASMMMAASLGVNMNTAGVFIVPLVEAMDVPVASVSLHITLITLGSALSGFVVPGILRRFNIRRIVLVSTLVTAGMTVLMGQTSDIYLFNFLSFIRGLAAAFFNVITVQQLINQWFVKYHGIVTSFVFSFSGIAGALLSPLLSSLITNYGLATAYLAQALLFLLINIPATVLPYTLDPREMGMEAYGAHVFTEEERDQLHEEQRPMALNLEQTRRNNLNIVLLMVFAFITTALTGLYQHLSGIGYEYGMELNQTSLLLSFCMIGNILFKLMIGWLSDAKNTVFAVISMFLVMLMGLILLSFGFNFTVLYIASFLFGAVYSVSSVGRNLLSVNLLPRDTYGRVFPVINFVSSIGGALMISFFGLTFDMTQSYQTAITLCIVMSLLGITSTLFMKALPQTE